MMEYESMGAIEEAITIFRVRHPDFPLRIKSITNEKYEINITEPETGFCGIVYIPRNIYRDFKNYDELMLLLIETLENLYDEIGYILEGKTCEAIVN